jgi:hypothetical protein
MNTVMPTKIAKRRADFPHAVIPPDREKSGVIALIKTMAVVTDQILNQASAFEAIDLCCYFIRH